MYVLNVPYYGRKYGKIKSKGKRDNRNRISGEKTAMQITLFSFGYKHGSADADTVLDMRFLPNPFYVPELKEGTGLETRISEYVLDNSVAQDFFKLFEPVLLSYISKHFNAGRRSLHLAVGCTGGRHRSVAVVEYLRSILNSKAYELTVFHRDIDKK